MRRHREYMERQRGRPRGDTLVNNQYSAGSTLLNTSKIDHKHIVHSPSPNRKGIATTVASNMESMPIPGSAQEVRAKRRHAALFDDMHGRFATKRGAISTVPESLSIPMTNTLVRNTNLPGGQLASSNNAPMARSKRRASVSGALLSMKSTIQHFVEEAQERIFMNDEALEELWDAMDSYHVLPVFASAKAFVPSSFESLLVQSYYVKLTPVICEKFVCGQLSQSMMCIEMPKDLVGWMFKDLFRLFVANQVVVIGMYRAPSKALGSTLPYVYTSPPKSTILCSGDRVYVYGTMLNVTRAKLSASQMPMDWKKT